MTPRRVGGKASFDRKVAHRGSDFGNLFAVRQAITRVSQPAKQTNETGCEESDARGSPNRPVPASNQILPHKWQHKEIGPEYQFRVVPFPGRGLEQVGKKKYGRCSHGESQRSIHRQSLIFPMKKKKGRGGKREDRYEKEIPPGREYRCNEGEADHCQQYWHGQDWQSQTRLFGRLSAPRSQA